MILSASFLVILIISNNVLVNTPRADCMTALEVWILVCLCLIFGTFLQFGILLLKRQKSYVRTLTVENVKYEAAANGVNGPGDDALDAEEYLKIDRYYLIMFPVLFVIFNLIYWLAYLV